VNVLSVDLGTSNTVAVLSAHGRPPRVVDVDGATMMPSAVFAAEAGGLVVGRDAERRARLDPSRFEPNPKRRIDEGTLLLGDSIVPVTDVLAGVLRRVAEETSRQLGGKRPDEVRLTHPAQWGPVRRNVLLSAARQAGMGINVILVPEPVAAAAHFASFPGQTLTTGQALAVYDLGAGTFDVAIVGATQKGFVVLAEAGLADLGGLDVDQALLEHVGRQVAQRDPARWQSLLCPMTTSDRRAQRALREDVKAAKESLSRHPQTDLPLPEPFDDVLITRVELEALIRPGLLRSVELLAATIRSTGMAPDRLAGIYLVGGSSRIPLIAMLIAEQLRVVPTTLDQPETAVALGAHHVPHEGVTLRTSDMSNALDAVRRQVLAGPRTSGFAGGGIAAPPAASPTPTSLRGSGAQPVRAQRPPVGPGPAYPTLHTSPAGAGHPPQPVRLTARSNRKPLVVLGVIVAIAAIAVLGVVIFKPGGGSANGADCSHKQTDDKGFTSCMRALAGAVVERSDCQSGVVMPGAGQTITTPGAISATCTLDGGYTVFYYHFNSTADVTTYVDGLFTALQKDKEAAVSGGWEGAGLKGTYYELDVGLGVGALVFTVDAQPVTGTVMKLSGGGQGSLGDYFNNEVKPGTGGQ
jgi:actin-like ATPase involved in cell morphogenesis